MSRHSAQHGAFKDKKILLLLPTNENRFFNYDCVFLKRSYEDLVDFNYVDYFCRQGIRNTEKYVRNLILENNIDLVFVFPFASNHELSVEFYRSLKDKVKIVFWMFDDAYYFNSYSKYYGQVADAVFTTTPHYVLNYERLGIPAVLFISTYSTDDFYPVETEKDIDVSFLGDCNQSDRKSYINFLINNGINVETYGIGSKHGPTGEEETSRIYSRSKINLNFTKMKKLDWINRNEPPLDETRQVKGRPIEIAMTRSFCLTEAAPGLENIFENNEEMVVFHDAKELLEKVRYYLSHEAEREKIADNAYRRAIDNYRSDVHIPRALKDLEETLISTGQAGMARREVSLSNDFKTAAVNSLVFSMFILLKNGKLTYAMELFRELFKYGLSNFLAGFYGGVIRAFQNLYDKTAKKLKSLTNLYPGAA